MLLEQAKPPLRCCQPGSAVAQPEAVSTLRRYLVKDLGIGVIPRQLEVSAVRTILRRAKFILHQSQLKTADPDGYDDIPFSAFSDVNRSSEHEVAQLWQHVYAIYAKAERSNNCHKDESAWVDVVRAVLQAADLENPGSMLEINSM